MNIKEITNNLNTELGYDFYVINDDKLYFCGIELTISETIHLKYEIKRKSKPIIQSLLMLLSTSDIISELDEDDVLDEIGEDSAKNYFGFKYLDEYSTNELKEQLHDNILPIKSIVDEFKLKHLLNVWDKYSDTDLERLLPDVL